LFKLFASSLSIFAANDSALSCLRRFFLGRGYMYFIRER